MRRLLRIALALAVFARAAPLDTDEDRLPGWLGERDRDAADEPPKRWIEPISWQPRCGAFRALLPTRAPAHRARRPQRVSLPRLPVT